MIDQRPQFIFVKFSMQCVFCCLKSSFRFIDLILGDLLSRIQDRLSRSKSLSKLCPSVCLMILFQQSGALVHQCLQSSQIQVVSEPGNRCIDRVDRS